MLPNYNVCGKIVKEEYRYINKYKNAIDYLQWSEMQVHYPHPILPKDMLDSEDFTGEELFAHIRNILKKHEIVGLDKKMLEIGGRDHHSYKKNDDYWNLDYYNLNIENPYNQEKNIVDDITQSTVPDSSYDFIYSMDTFEHITEPWLAAKEISRILKPKGIVFIVTLFSWRYHPDPIDYWRFTPHCLVYLFKDLHCIEANWDIKNRRTPQQGHEGDNDICPEDHFGPWEENWRVYYIGEKL